MGYGSELISPGLTGRTPEGRTSWKDALNQSKGYIKWSLKFLSLEEFTAQINEVVAKKLRNTAFDSLEKRWLYLKQLQATHRASLDSINHEIQRTENYLEDEKIQELENSFAENLSHIPNKNFQLSDGRPQ